MAVVLIEGFDHVETSTLLALKGWGMFFGSGGGATMDTGRLGGNCLKINSNNNLGQVIKPLPATYSTLFMGFAYKHDAVAYTATEQLLLYIGAPGNVMMSLAINQLTNKMEVRNNAGALITTGSFVYLDTVWNYVELKLVIAGAAGTIQVKANGVDDIATFTGNFGSTNASEIRFVGQSAGGYSATNGYFDDVYVLDTSGAAPRNTFLGDTRVETIVPDGAGNSTVWTPNTGANYAAVDEMTGTYPDGDTTYVSSGTPGDIDTYTYENLTIASGTVFGVQTNLYARKDDAGVRQIAPVIRQSGTDYVGATVTLTTSYVFYSEIFNQDPTAADWTISTVNADEFGVKEIA